MCSAAPRSEGAYFLWVPAPSSKRETAIVIEYSIGEPFNKSGNGIRLCINVLCWGKRSHHHFNVQAVLKEHLACHLSGPWEQNDTDFFLLCTLCECSSPNILCGYLAYFPIHPSAPLRDLGGGIQAALQKVIVMKSPSGVLALSPIFLHLHAVCVGWWGL